MNKDIIEGNWKELKGKIQAKWGKLTDDDLDVVSGKATELSGIIQKRYGMARDRAEKEVDEFFASTSEIKPMSGEQHRESKL